LDGHSVGPRSLNVSALPIRIIQKFFAGFLGQRTTGGDGRSKSAASHLAGELLTNSLFLCDGGAVVSACASPSRISCVDRIAKSGISRYSWPPTTFNGIACTAAPGVQEFLRACLGGSKLERRNEASPIWPIRPLKLVFVRSAIRVSRTSLRVPRTLRPHPAQLSATNR